MSNNALDLKIGVRYKITENYSKSLVGTIVCRSPAPVDDEVSVCFTDSEGYIRYLGVHDVQLVSSDNIAHGMTIEELFRKLAENKNQRSLLADEYRTMEEELELRLRRLGLVRLEDMEEQ